MIESKEAEKHELSKALKATKAVAEDTENTINENKDRERRLVAVVIQASHLNRNLMKKLRQMSSINVDALDARKDVREAIDKQDKIQNEMMVIQSDYGIQDERFDVEITNLAGSNKAMKGMINADLLKSKDRDKIEGINFALQGFDSILNAAKTPAVSTHDDVPGAARALGQN